LQKVFHALPGTVYDNAVKMDGVVRSCEKAMHVPMWMGVHRTFCAGVVRDSLVSVKASIFKQLPHTMLRAARDRAPAHQRCGLAYLFKPGERHRHHLHRSLKNCLSLPRIHRGLADSKQTEGRSLLHSAKVQLLENYRLRWLGRWQFVL